MYNPYMINGPGQDVLLGFSDDYSNVRSPLFLLYLFYNILQSTTVPDTCFYFFLIPLLSDLLHDKIYTTSPS